MNTLPELLALEKIIELGAPHLQVRVLRQVQAAPDASFPILAIGLGNPAADAPAMGFFGGVHGLERIGAQVVIAYLQNVVMRLGWDATLHHQLEHMRMVFMPVVNPGGMWAATRANPRGVLGALLRRPHETPALLAIARDTWRARRRLSSALMMIGDDFGLPPREIPAATTVIEVTGDEVLAGAP